MMTKLSTQAGLVVGLAILIAGLPAIVGEYHLHMFILTLIGMMLGLGHRLLFMTRQASFGHGAFYAMGAYATAMTTTNLGLSPWLSLPIAVAVPAVAALVISGAAFRTRGPYFILLSFGLAVVTQSLLISLKDWTGGNSGILGIPHLEGVTTVREYYYLTGAVFVAIFLLFLRIEYSRWFLELKAIGASQDLASSVGLSANANMTKTLVIGASIGGGLGGIYASYVTFVAPTAFTFWVSVYILTYTVIGGSKYIFGPVIGAGYITLMPLIFNWSQNLMALFVSASIAIIMLLLPRGVATELIDRIWPPKKVAPSSGVAVAPVDLASPAAVGHTPRQPGALEVSGLNKNFGGVRAARDISFAVQPGETLGIIGPNGAGKTTLFNLISGFLPIESGQITFNGKSILGLKPEQIQQLGLTRTFQSSVAFEDLTVYENVLLGVWGRSGATTVWQRNFASRSPQDDAAVREILQLFGLEQVGDVEAGSLPYGLKKLLGLAVGFSTGPSILCLDEPVAGMTDAEVERMVQTLRLIREKYGTTLLVVEHRMPIIMGICDKVLVLNFGEVLTYGTPEQVTNDPQVAEVYFGRK